MFFHVDQLGSIYDLRENFGLSSLEFQKVISDRKVWLQEIGVGPGSRAMIIHGNNIDFFADLLALWSVGACVACLNPSVTSIEMTNLQKSFRPDYLVVRSLPSDVQPIDDAIVISISTQDYSKGADLRIRQSSGAIEEGGSIDAPALVLYTSGSTGTPKGVVHTFRSLSARISLNHSYIPKTEMKNSLNTLPTHFGHGLIGNCLTPLLAGCNLFTGISGNNALMLKLSEIIDKYSISFFSSVPSFWKLVLHTSQPQKQSLQRIHVGSAPFSQKLWREVIAWSGVKNVWNMYGLTETANWVGGASSLDGIPAEGSVGYAWGGQFAVYEQNSGEVSLSGTGELLVSTPSVMAGYFEQSTLTSDSFLDGWLRTGDIGVIENGEARLVGRSKFEINKGGIKISPEELDGLFEKHAAVSEACAFGIPDNLAGERIGVALVTSNENISVLELRDWALTQLVAEKVPDDWFFVDEIPKNDRGKIDRLNIYSYVKS